MNSTEKKLKPFKGHVEDWFKLEIPEKVMQAIRDSGEDPGLGYCIRGTCVDHPIFGTDRFFRSSWVVKHDGNEVETRNSRYTLGKQDVDEPL